MALIEKRPRKTVGPVTIARLQRVPTHVASFDSLSEVLACCSHD